MSLQYSRLLRRLCLSALLVMATGLFAQDSADQPLGDVARHARAEREQRVSRRKVYTNDDFTKPDSDDQTDTADSNAQPSKTADGASAAKPDSGAAASDATTKDDAKKDEERKKRNDDINKSYTDRVDQIRKQIAETKQDLERLQRDQVESTNQYRNSNGTSPSTYEYQEQQRQIQQQMDNDRNQLASLNAQLEDAQEAARHAGVRAKD